MAVTQVGLHTPADQATLRTGKDAGVKQDTRKNWIGVAVSTATSTSALPECDRRPRHPHGRKEAEPAVVAVHGSKKKQQDLKGGVCMQTWKAGLVLYA